MKSRFLFTLEYVCIALALALPLSAKTLPPLPAPAFADVLASPPSWIYDTRWDRMRITARGEMVRDALFNLAALSRGNAIFIR